MLSPEIKKAVLVAGAAFTMIGCFDQHPPQPIKPAVVTEAPPRQDQMLQSVHREVIRLATTFPEDSLVRKVYLGDLTQLSPIFKSPLLVGVFSRAYAGTDFERANLSPNKSFRYILESDQTTTDYATLQPMETTIYFSPEWLNSKSDTVKALALEKEAYAIIFWENFSQIVLNSYKEQGRIEKIDPEVTETDIRYTLARQWYAKNPDIRKLYDYAGYLAILSKVGQLLALQDPEVNAALADTDLITVYQLARDKKINFDSLVPNSDDFFRLAFDNNGPWGKMILEN